MYSYVHCRITDLLYGYTCSVLNTSVYVQCTLNDVDIHQYVYTCRYKTLINAHL